jgi:hypothetical protein
MAPFDPTTSAVSSPKADRVGTEPADNRASLICEWAKRERETSDNCRYDRAEGTCLPRAFQSGANLK